MISQKLLPVLSVDPWKGVYPEPSAWETGWSLLYRWLVAFVLPTILAWILAYQQGQQAEYRILVHQRDVYASKLHSLEVFDPNKACASWWFGGAGHLIEAKDRLCGGSQKR